MSGLDVASAIAGVISLAIQVSSTIAQYSIAVKDHAKNVNDLQGELELLGNVLSRLSDFIRSERQNGREFEHDSVLVGAIRDCKRRIERIGDKLKTSNGGKISRAIDKLKWPFEQRDVLQLVENLRRYIHIFEFAVTIKNCEFLSKNWDDASRNLKELQKRVDLACETHKLLGEPVNERLVAQSQQLQNIIDILPTLLQQSQDLKEVTAAVQLAEQREQEKRKTDILDWLIPLSTLHKHVELQHRRAAGTCDWLLESEQFIEWAGSEDVQFDLLCQGGPGVGKTMLCSIVTDHLRTTYKQEDVAVVYYYFDLAEQQAQTEYSLSRSILRQLCQSFQSIPTAVADFYQRTRNELQDSLWLQELQGILQRIIATFSQCFIVIDALDEIEVKKRKSILAILETLKSSSGLVKFFATSRPYVVLDQFQHALRLDVRADYDDLRQFLCEKIDNHPQSEDIIDAELKVKILNKLCNHADGVFLLPALQIDQILDQAVSAGDIERALENLSTDLKEVFQSTIIRIERFSGGKRNLAFKALMWLSHARRPLRISELQHALAVRFDSPEVDPRDISTESVILDSCCGLIELDGASATIRFVHGSISEYLQNNDHGFFQNAELEMVRICLKYLTMESLRSLPFKNRGDFLRSMESFPLLEYASTFWGFHARGVEVQQYADLALPFLSSSVHLLVTARVKDVKTSDYRKWKERMLAWSVSGGAGISLAASYGLADLTRLLIGQLPNPVLDSRNIFGSTPLHECAILGHEDTAEVLIAHGADVMDSNSGKATPFYLAVSYGQLNMCRMLFKYSRAQLDVVCKGGNTVLHKAADLGSDVMVEFLLQSGALVAARNELGMTPLHLAARRGYVSVVRLLVLAGANVSVSNNESLAALDLAALGGHQETVKYLIQQNADINNMAKDKWTPLRRAAKSGYSEVVKLLLASGAIFLDTDRQGSIPLQQAVKSRDLATVKAIIFHDNKLVSQQLNHQDRKKDRAIDIAFYTTQYDIYQFLRDLEATTADRDSRLPVDPLLPLTYAIEQGDLQQVQQLLHENPGWLVERDSMDQTCLHTAFFTKQRVIAEYLLQAGASIDSRGHHGWTPLHIAASLGDIRMLELALGYNADIFLVTETLQTPLHKAASSRSSTVLAELLKCGCLPSALNDKAMTPLHVAASLNFLEGIFIMIRPENGGRHLLLARDRFGLTPRGWADRAGHLELSSVLRQEERRSYHHFAGGAESSSPSVGNQPTLDNGNNRRPHSQLSRRSTRDSALSRQSTSSPSTLLPPRPSLLEHGTPSRTSTGSFGESADASPNLGGAGGDRSHQRSLSGTPGASPSPALLVEQQFAAMQIEFDSD